MAATGTKRSAKAAALFLASLFLRASTEVISDLVTSSVDESRALEIKTDQFWRSLLDAAEDMRLAEHLELCAHAEKVARELPVDNSYIRQALLEAAERLRRADKVVLAQATASSKLAAERLAGPASQGMFSFFTAGQDFLGQALLRFVDGGEYAHRLGQHVKERQADILPVLQGMAGTSGDVLGDCRLASKRAFDVLKYDLYNKGMPKTPEAAKQVANRLVDAAGETRSRFMRFITQTVSGIAQDVAGQAEQASATVVRSSVAVGLPPDGLEGGMLFVNQ